MGLKQKTVTGFLWSSAGTFGNGVISLIVTMVLARLLLPYHFALIALLTVFLSISNVIVDSGFSQALIRDDNPSQKDLSSVFYFNITISILIYSILYLSTPFISAYFKASELNILARIVFLVIIFNSFTLIQYATLNRDLEFALLNKSSVYGNSISGSIAIIMAFSGFGIWALVANMVLMPFFRSVFLWYNSKWRPTKEFSLISVRKYFAFGGFLMVQGIIDAISTNLITLLIGKAYTKNDLGYFSQGAKLDAFIITPFTSIVQKVTYPILSKIKNEGERLKESFRKVVGVIMYAFIPAILFTIFNSDNLIVSFFGEQWREAGLYLKIAAFGSILFPLQIICINIIMIKAETKIMLQFAIIKQSVRIILLLAFLNKGVIALATVFSISTLIGSILYITLGMRILRYTFLEFIQDVFKTLVSSLIGIVFVLYVGCFFNEVNVAVVLAIQSGCMLIIYVLSSIIFRNEHGKESFSLLLPLYKKIKFWKFT